MSKKPKGRPAGSKTQQRPHATAEPSRCPKCDSTKRKAYKGSPRVLEQGGMLDGKPYTHVVWRRTACADCGQARVDKSFENRNGQ